MRANHPLNRIEYQVMWNRLISVVEEQAQTLVRTAFGTATREAGDLSAGVYDTQGRMLAQAVTGTPGHVNSMAMSVGYVLDKGSSCGTQTQVYDVPCGPDLNAIECCYAVRTVTSTEVCE